MRSLSVVTHALARPQLYPLTGAHVSALTALGPWLAKNVKKSCPALSHWLAACLNQLQSLTAEEPQPPADCRRAAPVTCKCGDCGELRQFLIDDKEAVHRFRVAEARRSHLEGNIRGHGCDLTCQTERRGSPYTLVCTKNTASYEAALKTFHQNLEHLATLRSMEGSLAK